MIPRRHNIKIASVPVNNDQADFEKAFNKFTLRQLESLTIDEWNKFDLRITCQHFDIFAVGCFGCKYYSESRGYLGLDYRLTCHLEQELYNGEITNESN